MSAYYALSVLALVALSAASTTFERDGQANATGAGGPSIFLAIHHGALSTPDVRWRLSASYLWLGWVAGFGAVVAEVVSRKLTMTTTQAGLLAGFFGLMVIAGNLCNGRIQQVIGNAALPVTALGSALGVLLFLLPVIPLLCHIDHTGPALHRQIALSIEDQHSLSRLNRRQQHRPGIHQRLSTP